MAQVDLDKMLSRIKATPWGLMDVDCTLPVVSARAFGGGGRGRQRSRKLVACASRRATRATPLRRPPNRQA